MYLKHKTRFFLPPVYLTHTGIRQDECALASEWADVTRCRTKFALLVPFVLKVDGKSPSEAPGRASSNQNMFIYCLCYANIARESNMVDCAVLHQNVGEVDHCSE